MTKKKKRSTRNPWLAPFICLVLTCFLAVTIIKPDLTFSQVENRSLQTFQMPGWKGMADGEDFRQMENWFTDQIVGRNTFFHLNYLMQKMLGVREIQDVFLGKKALLGNPDEEIDAAGSQNAQAAAQFAAASSLEMHVGVISGAAVIQPQLLPANAPVNSQQQAMENSAAAAGEYWVDMNSALVQNAESPLYYKTDHHMTSYGAFLAAQSLLASFGISVNPDDFDYYPVCDDFEGTLASATGSVGLKDTIEIAVAKDNPTYTVTWADGSRTASMYDTSALDKKDKYQLFLGANQSVVVVETTVKNGRNLLLLKDSYANEMIQFLLPYFSSIVIVDPRYCYDDVDDLMTRYSIDSAACVFSADTWLTQTRLASFLAASDDLQALLAAQAQQNAEAEETAAPEEEIVTGEEVQAEEEVQPEEAGE